MHELQAFQHLINDVLLVNVLEDVGSNDSMKISIHEIEDEVYISIVFGSYNILQANNVLVARQLLQEDDFPECTLSICCVLECIKVLLQRHDVLCLLVDGLPNDTVGTLAYNRHSDQTLMAFEYFLTSRNTLFTYPIFGEFRTSSARELQSLQSFFKFL